MKKLLIGLSVLALTAAVAVTGYIVVDELLAPEEGDAVAVAASSTAVESVENVVNDASSSVKVNFMKPVKTAADILSAADYEYSQNKDTIGWLNIPDTEISSSVLQSFDNAYYLRRDERKKDNIYGCYFADYTCNFGTREKLSPNTVIYGHSDFKDNPNGPRFSQLFRFLDEKFARTHPVVYFSTREELMAWQVFAVFYTDFTPDFAVAELDGPSLLRLAEQAQERSLFDYPVTVSADDQILTLVTCSEKYGKERTDQRFILMAKLMPADWTPERSIALTTNPDPIVPFQ